MSIESDLDDKTFEALQKAQVFLAEHFIMCTVGYRVRLPKQSLARMTKNFVEGDSRGNFSQNEYEEAIDQCISKKWLHTFTPESYEAEVERQRTSQVPELFDTAFHVSDVDFTAAGYLLFRQTILDIFGQEHINDADSGWNRDDRQRRFQVLTPTLQLCLRIIEGLIEDPSSYAGEDVAIVAVSEPERIKLWKPNPFIELHEGFSSEVRYKPIINE